LDFRFQISRYLQLGN